jgi:hypothetical protein
MGSPGVPAGGLFLGGEGGWGQSLGGFVAGWGAALLALPWSTAVGLLVGLTVRRRGPAMPAA